MTVIQKFKQNKNKLDQGALGMSDPCGTLQLALKPNSVPRNNCLLTNFYFWALICCPLSNGRPRGSHGVMVGLPGPRGSRVWPKGSQGVKGLTCRIQGGQGEGLLGLRGSRGRPTGSQGVKG